MQCEEYLSLLSAHLDGALDAHEEARLQAHLAQCAHCRALLKEWQAQQTALEDVPPMPERLHADVMRQVRASEKKRRPARRWIPLAAGAAAAAAMLTLAVSGVLPMPATKSAELEGNEAATMAQSEQEFGGYDDDTGNVMEYTDGADAVLADPEIGTPVMLTGSDRAEPSAMVLLEPLPDGVAELLETCPPVQDEEALQDYFPELASEDSWRGYELDDETRERLAELLTAADYDSAELPTDGNGTLLVFVIGQS